MRKSKGRGEKTAANGRAQMVRGNECGRGAGGKKARKKTAREWAWSGGKVWRIK